jgi:hypothetical protein
MMKVFTFLFLLAGFFVVGCGKKETPPAQPTNAPATASGNPLTAPVDYLGAVAKAKKVADKTVGAAGFNQAIQMFQASEGRLPKTLNELVPDYLPSLPAPPAGMKYDYNPATGQFKVVAQ